LNFRLRLSTLALFAMVIAIGACSDGGPADPRGSFEFDSAMTSSLESGPTEKDNEFLPHLKAGYFTVCKVAEGSTEMFNFLTVAEGPGVPTAPIYLEEFTLGDDDCNDVYQAPVVEGSDVVTITEVATAGWQVDRVFIWSLEIVDGEPETTWHELPAGTTTVSGSISAAKLGCVVIFYNSEEPDVPGECTRTPGYWKTHPEAWPVDSITIGGTTYTKEEALAILWTPERGDKSKTLFRALVAASLNKMSGTDVSCVESEMSAAHDWLMMHPACSNVRGNSDAWDVGEPLYTTLDDYNNGLLCAPHCEDGDDDDDDHDDDHDADPRGALKTEL
jgi:hypothetical protein